jgi:ankyrin repeat protein
MDYIGDYRLVESSSKETRKIIDLFVSSGGDINAADKFGRSALIHVTKEFNSRNERKVLDIIPYLFEKGARNDLRDKDGLTAKDYASRSRNSSLINLFSGR